jgi:hypothetical protein
MMELSPITTDLYRINFLTVISMTSEAATDGSQSSSDSAFTPLSEYCPFIADVPISSFAEPFPIAHPDTRTDDEIETVKRNLRKVIHVKKFDPPLPLADFCLIARERWDADDEESAGSGGECALL